MLITLATKAMEQEDLSKAFAELTIIDPTKNQPKTLAEACLGYFGINDLQDNNNLKKIMYGYTHFQRPVRVPSHLAVLIIEKFTNNFIEKVAPQVAAELFITNLADETKIAIIKRIGQSAKVDECRGIFQQLMHDSKTGNKIKECINQHDPLFQSMKTFITQRIYAQKLPEHQKLIEQHRVDDTASSPDGNYCAIRCGTSIIIIATKDNHWQRVAILTGHILDIISVSWSPNSKYFLTSSEDRTAKIWTVNNNQWQCIATLYGNIGRIWLVSWSSDGRYLVTSPWGTTTKIWDVHLLNTIIQYPFSYDEILLVKAIVDAQKSGITHQLNKHQKQIFNQLGGNDTELRDALHNVLKPLVDEYDFTTQFMNIFIHYFNKDLL